MLSEIIYQMDLQDEMDRAQIALYGMKDGDAPTEKTTQGNKENQRSKSPVKVKVAAENLDLAHVDIQENKK